MKWYKVEERLPESGTRVVALLDRTSWGGNPTFALCIYGKTYGFELDDDGVDIYASDDTGLGCKLLGNVVEWTEVTHESENKK